MSLAAGRPSKKMTKQTETINDFTNTDKKKVRVNFNLDEDRFIALKKHAADSRKTVTQLLIDMIDENIIQR